MACCWRRLARPFANRERGFPADDLDTTARVDSLCWSQEAGEHGGELPRCLFGDEVTSGYHSSDEILCPGAPDLARVCELRLVFADDDQDRCAYAAPSSAIIGIVLAIEVKARAVVGAHGRDRRRCQRPAIRLTAVRIDGIGTTCPRIEDVLQKPARIATDQALGKWSRLGEEEHGQ